MNMNPDSAAAKAPEKLVSDISKMMDEAEQMLGDSTSHHAEEKVALLRARLRDAQERLADFYDQAKQKIAAGARQTDQAIRTHPYESIAVALGVGLLVGALLGRRSASR